MAVHPPRPRIWSSVAKAMLPWLLVFFVAHRMSGFRWPPPRGFGEPYWWLHSAAEDIARILPFVLFAAGVVLVRKLGSGRPLLRAVALVGISLSAVSYALDAWVAPVVRDRYLAGIGAETAMGPVRASGRLQGSSGTCGSSKPILRSGTIFRWRLQSVIRPMCFGGYCTTPGPWRSSDS